MPINTAVCMHTYPQARPLPPSWAGSRGGRNRGLSSVTPQAAAGSQPSGPGAALALRPRPLSARPAAASASPPAEAAGPRRGAPPAPLPSPAPVLASLLPRAAAGDAGPGPVLPWPAGGWAPWCPAGRCCGGGCCGSVGCSASSWGSPSFISSAAPSSRSVLLSPAASCLGVRDGAPRSGALSTGGLLKRGALKSSGVNQAFSQVLRLKATGFWNLTRKKILQGLGLLLSGL